MCGSKNCELLTRSTGCYTKYPCFIHLCAIAELGTSIGLGNLASLNKYDGWRKRMLKMKHWLTGKNVFPPLNIKPGLMKPEFVKALNKEDNSFQYICSAFPGLSCEKVKAKVFDGPQVRQLINDQSFITFMTAMEKRAWEVLVSVVKKLFW